MQGNITFNVPDRSLYVKAVRYQATGEEAIDVTSFSQGYINENFNLDLTSLSQAEPNKHGSFTLYFDIINATNMQWAIERVTLSETLISEGVTESHSGIIEVNELAETDSEGFKVFDVATAPYDTLSLTITAPQTNIANPLNLSDITITIKEYIPPEITDFTFATTSASTGAVTSYTGSATEIEIPSTFSVITEELETAGYTMKVESLDEFYSLANNEVYQVIIASGFYWATPEEMERRYIEDGVSFYIEIVQGQISFPITFELIDYTIEFEYYTNPTELFAIIRPCIEVLSGKVETATITLNTGEIYNINATNAMEIVTELSNRSYIETDFPIEINYPKTRNIYVEGNDYQVTSIGAGAFADQINLTSVIIPEGVTSIGESAFWDCSGLTSIIIPEGVTSIGDSAFHSCDGLTSVTLPSSLTSIGSDAFRNCSGLTGITIPEGVTSIGINAFNDCSNLATVYIDNSTIANGITSSSSYEYLTRYATTLYIKDSITVTTAPSGWTQDPNGSDQVEGYIKYIKA